MTTFLGCIADDFTGATDLAGLLARSGLPVSLRIGVPSDPPQDGQSIEVIALKCRSTPVHQAINEVMRAYQWLNAAGAQRYFWKYCSTFDSTEHGNIGPVAEALMSAIGTDQTIYCPAFPENGRSIFMGNLFVGEQLLSESPMKDHPLNPMRDSNLMRLLDPQTERPTGLINRLTIAQGADAIKNALDALGQRGIAHIVTDAVANDDLFAIAEACQDMPLLTGGSAIAMPLPDLFVKRGFIDANDATHNRPNIPSPAIVLSGSCSAMTRSQVTAYAKSAPSHKISPLELAEHGTTSAEQWLRGVDLNSAPLIYATADPDEVSHAQSILGRDKAGHLVETALAHLASVARDLGARRFVIAGGETSGAVTTQLKITRLDIGHEIAPGVPWTYCNSDGISLALTLKSGNFGRESFFSDALTSLGA